MGPKMSFSHSHWIFPILFSILISSSEAFSISMRMGFPFHSPFPLSSTGEGIREGIELEGRGMEEKKWSGEGDYEWEGEGRGMQVEWWTPVYSEILRTLYCL